MKFLTPLVFLIIAGALGYWVINPLYQKVGQLRIESTQYQAALTRAQNAIVKRNDLVTKYNNMSDSDLQRLQKVLPDTTDSIKLIVDISAIASKYGSNIKNIKLTDTPVATTAATASSDAKPYTSQTTTFTVSLSYENFLRFLTDLQQNLRVTDVTGVDFNALQTGVYDYTTTIKTYVMK